MKEKFSWSNKPLKIQKKNQLKNNILQTSLKFTDQKES
jgi:hypothetical protein